ncbi:hypothetical protein JTB14_038339 [Gonioctena quinquepunctata]|nr:hypothetical protein JTB14_038339 [Gonioctena quinquepunctata]
MSLEYFHDIIGPTTIERLKNETEDSKHEEKSEEWKLLLNIFRKFSSQVSNAETQEKVLRSFGEEIHDMPVVIESHLINDIEDTLILETNAEGLEKEYENNTFRLVSLPNDSDELLDVVETTAGILADLRSPPDYEEYPDLYFKKLKIHDNIHELSDFLRLLSEKIDTPENIPADYEEYPDLYFKKLKTHDNTHELYDFLRRLSKKTDTPENFLADLEDQADELLRKVNAVASKIALVSIPASTEGNPEIYGSCPRYTIIQMN